MTLGKVSLSHFFGPKLASLSFFNPTDVQIPMRPGQFYGKAMQFVIPGM